MTNLTDNHNRLFGRQKDLDHLISRANKNGVTIVYAGPMLGKTWLLMESARRMVERDYLVGYTEAIGETDDMFLRVIVDMYERWLSNSSFREQAYSIWKRRKKTLVTDVGKAVGEIIEGVSAAPLGKLVNKTFRGLAEANDDLKTGGLQLKRLSYEQGKELIDIVAEISGKYVVLILDALDRAPSVALEMDKLQSFLSHIDDWQPCHIFAGIRQVPVLIARAEELADRAPETELYELKSLDTKDPAVVRPMIHELRTAVPAARHVSEKMLLKWIDGFPGVLARWRKVQPTGRQQFQSLAADAHACRYQEFKVTLPELTEDERRLAIRLAIFPRLDRLGWDTYSDILLEGELKEELLDTLYEKRVLEGDEGTNYGHETRHEAVRLWLLKPDNKYRQHVRRELEKLAFALASRVHGVESKYARFTFVLRVILPFALQIDATDDVISLSLAACALFPDNTEFHVGAIILGASVAVKRNPQTADLLAIGIANTVLKLPMANRNARTGLVMHLMGLDTMFPEFPVVAESLARAIYSTIQIAGHADESVAALGVLRELRQRYPLNVLIRSHFAMGLSGCVGALNSSNTDEADHLLAELRELQAGVPDDKDVCESFANALFNACNARNAVDDSTRQAELLAELRQLSANFPGQLGAARILGMRLLCVLNDAKSNVSFSEFNGLLQELRALRALYPSDSAIKEHLPIALINILSFKKGQFSAEYLESVRNELRILCETSPDDAFLRSVPEMLRSGKL